MNDLERFKAVCAFEKPDYVPIFGFPGSPGMAGGCMRKTWQHLVDQGMPEWLDGCGVLGEKIVVDKWYRYWGTTGCIQPDFFPGEEPEGIKKETRIEGEWEIIESETGALTRQVIDNAVTYSMPDYVRFDVCDRKSWEFYRDRMTPGEPWSAEQLDAECRRFDERDKPLAVHMGNSWAGIRRVMGPAAACTILYDDPKLAHEIIDWSTWKNKTYLFPLIERLRPEIVGTGEDCCYNHGMHVSPRLFDEFCKAHYKAMSDIAFDCGASMVHIDTDGNAMEFTGVVIPYGVNALHPYEVKAGNDLFALRERYPDFILMGWLEKESVNEGNGRSIEQEIMSKVPALLEKGGYFPNGDHGIQPLADFGNLCKFMTLLHDVCGNPEGEFPRMKISG